MEEVIKVAAHLIARCGIFDADLTSLDIGMPISCYMLLLKIEFSLLTPTKWNPREVEKMTRDKKLRRPCVTASLLSVLDIASSIIA
jgi:hypothetical protein